MASLLLEPYWLLFVQLNRDHFTTQYPSMEAQQAMENVKSSSQPQGSSDIKGPYRVYGWTEPSTELLRADTLNANYAAMTAILNSQPQPTTQAPSPSQGSGTGSTSIGSWAGYDCNGTLLEVGDDVKVAMGYWKGKIVGVDYGMRVGIKVQLETNRGAWFKGDELERLDRQHPAVAKNHAHTWAKYVGFTDSFEYCTACDEKRHV
jgi:hypothetical protein